MSKDAAFVDEAEKLGFDVSPIDGDSVLGHDRALGGDAEGRDRSLQRARQEIGMASCMRGGTQRHARGIGAGRAHRGLPRGARARRRNFPAQTVKFVVPAAAGSTTDTLARLTADQLSRKWGKPAVVENIAGGGMNIGAAAVARAAPDGHTLLVGAARAAHHQPSAQQGPDLLAGGVRADHHAGQDRQRAGGAEDPARRLAQGADRLRPSANPGKLTFATQGPGSTAHLSAAQLEMLAGIKMVAVPYRGALLALNDIIAGTVDMFFDTLATSVPLYRGDKLKILAVAGSRARQDRAGAADLLGGRRAGLPLDHLVRRWRRRRARRPRWSQRLNRDVVEILRSKEVGERLPDISLEVGATSPAETAKFFADEAALWGKVIKEAGITPN